MPNGCISIDRVLSRLDEYLNKNDYAAAERHLLYWLDEAERGCDARTALTFLNELMGLYRKLGRRADALSCAEKALAKIESLGISHQVGAATTFLNCATVYKAFDMSERSLPLFERAREVYERELESDDSRLAGLYNNMALTLVDLGRFSEADALYRKAISIMERAERGGLEVAITYLNMATAAEAERGLIEAEAIISEYLERAEALLDAHPTRDGYYAFVCEKCASVFGYYGHFFYENELKERARRIYEGN
ncbi:MAG: tetratricopeptide repeat protein [Clostridia bacterium]|nr:tetratricopeptide repeat protein [Clostridia bacterium]